MTAIGHKERAQAILENIQRRAKETTTVKEIDRDEVLAIRHDLAAALETMAQEVDQIKGIIAAIGAAADRELSRRK